MIKPWLLMTSAEKRNRIELFHELVFHTFPQSEMLITMVRPPRDLLEAKFELWLYQLRNNRKGRD